ncbi:hypothetical protein PHIN3_151 [Sinorhizobium phage phiN3]|uniref:Uncharacterized protein n=1 Tax=Sinorhizobium phage phiN3 TaxID=1647405 RepID=A0A0F6WCP4_9CAUD|nr:hypothetical protein AVT40_gp382 [Sinorhizobium phage phiN3]AKF13414.1 hypothetical protein PHIN3_151 [Sinorhizobium phage phiN3]
MKHLANFSSVNNRLRFDRFKAFTGIAVKQSDFIVRDDYVVGIFETDKGVRLNTVMYQEPLTEETFSGMEDCSCAKVSPDQLDWVKSEIAQFMSDTVTKS